MEGVYSRARKIIEEPRRSSTTGQQEKNVLQALAEMQENLNFFSRLLRGGREVVVGVWQQALAPVWRFVAPPLRFIGRNYMRVWSSVVFVVDPLTRERSISRTRSTLMLVATVLCLSIFTDTRLGEAARFFSTEPLCDSVLIATSLRTEVFYLSQSEEVDPEQNVHAVRGCRSRGECSELDAVYFRVRPRLAHDVWKLFAYGNPVYVPDHVVAPIAPGINECHVTYYGYRMTASWIARILRSLQVYPTLLEVKCSHLNAG
jgi:hypothetical protein